MGDVLSELKKAIDDESCDPTSYMEDAVDEIERLRKALTQIINVSDLPREVERIAFDAVGKFQSEQSQGDQVK